MKIRYLLLVCLGLAPNLWAAPPVAVDDNFVGLEDGLVNGNVLDNDSDPDGDGIDLVSNTDPAGGNLVLAAGGGFTFTPDADFNGVTNFTYTIVEVSAACAVNPVPAGCEVSGSVTLTIDPVNDAPTLANPIQDRSGLEDGFAVNEDLSQVFADVDTITNGQVLNYSILGNTNPGLFSRAEILPGGGLVLELTRDANGAATIQVQADDGSEQVSDSFTVDVAAVNDIPVPADDAFAMLEDDGPQLIDVLANDYEAEGPAQIDSLVGGGVSDSGENFVVLDPTGNPVSGPNGTVVVVNGMIQYQPKPNFHGVDTFRYTIRDSSGGVDGLGDVSAPATVSVTVQAQNDPPTARERVEFTMLQDSILQVAPDQGLLQFVYDVEANRLDAQGDPQGGNFTSILSALPAVGIADVQPDGSFSYTPPVNFTGTVEFGYKISDGVTATATDLIVRILVRAPVAPPAVPNPGEVSVPFNLADSPLEQSTGVKPNVLLMLDDSGSMDWHISTPDNQNDAVLNLSNLPVALGNAVATNYYYLWPLADSTYGPTSLVGRILPTEAALAANVATANNEFGVWRARFHKHNLLYYNPAIRYQPWVGYDRLNRPFANAVPGAVRLDPTDPSDTIDLLMPVSYNAARVPTWLAGGGSVDVAVNNDYIPRYFSSNADAPVPVNAAFSEVRIEAGSGPLPNDRFPGGAQRTDCANANACTLAEELQNFANWFQYHRKREYVAKAGIGKVIEGVTGLRLGLETINETASAEVNDMNDTVAEGNKKMLLDSLYSINSANGTPLRDALERAGEIYRCNGAGNCPVLPAPAGTCQQNFTLLFSDGFWNASEGVPDNTDIDGPGPFDGGRYEDAVANTLADTAMFYYETDLQPNMVDRVPPSQRDLQGVSDVNVFANGARLHQHMKTFAIAFGVSGTVDPANIPADPAVPFPWPDPQNTDAAKVDDMLHAAINGRGQYLTAIDPAALSKAVEDAFIEFGDAQSSLSAAAFNSTSLRNGTFLFRGFFDLSDNTGDLTATEVNADGTLAANPIWSAADQLAPNITAAGNRRIVTFDAVNNAGVAFLPADITPAQQALLNPNQVNWLRGDQTLEQPAGSLRERDSDRLLGDIVNSSPIFVGEPRALNRDQAPYPLNDLYSDFANAKRNRMGMVYVGVNDGMLHGFEADTGTERYAYLPNKLIDANERFRNAADQLTDPLYSHKYFVDLTPRINDVYMRSSAGNANKSWNTVLLGGLGGGGKGFFALNITDPAVQFASNVAASNTVLWEFTDANDSYPLNPNGSFLGNAENAVLDPDGQPVKNLGYALSLPTLAMSNRPDGQGSNDWIAVFGNGPNSTAGIATLFALFVDDGLDGWDPGDFFKVSTGFGVPTVEPAELIGFPNGLGTPTLVDEDLNGTVDLAYAGDRLGNLFRFDLRDADPTNWSAVRIFTAENDNGLRQPILSKPTVTAHPTQPGFLIIFGTGSYLTEADGTSTDIQSIYGLWDDGTSANPATALAGSRNTRLIEQNITNVVDDTVVPAQTRRVVTRNDVVYAAEGINPGTFGWYIDLDLVRAAFTTSNNVNGDTSGNAPPLPQFPGEKAIRNFIVRNGTVITPTVLPSTGASACFGPRAGAILVFDALTGGDARDPIIDFNTDGVISEADLVAVGPEKFSAGLLLDVGMLDGPLVDLATVGAVGDTDFLFVSGGNKTEALRISDVNDSRTGRLSWRELEEN